MESAEGVKERTIWGITMRKLGIAAITLFFVLFFLPILTSAVKLHGIEILGEYQIPDDFEFQISDACSGHSSFKQATAREDGWFAVCSLHTKTERGNEEIFNLHYIDIYDSNGKFVEEISFSTELDNAIELTDDTLFIYFQTFVVSYNLQSREVLSYSIPPRATIENGLLFMLEKDKFTSGEWTYYSTGGWVNYTKLTRSNTSETQVLLDYTSEYCLLFPMLFAIIVLNLLFASFLIYKSKVNKR